MQQIARSLAMAFNHFPRSHCVVLGSLSIITLAVAIWRPYIYFPVIERTINRAFLSENSQLHDLKLEANEYLYQLAPESDKDISKNVINEYIKEEGNVYKHTISDGDTINSVLIHNGIDKKDINILTQQNPVLLNLKTGQTLSWKLTPRGDLQRVTWDVSQCEIRTYTRASSRFKENITNMLDTWHNTTLTGQLNGSFVNSARAAGLTESDINEVIKALQWQLDFRKLRQGDQFLVIISREMLNKKSAKSQLLGVRLRTSGRDYYAFRADDGNFYNRDATSLAWDFMRFPTVKQFRVSSNFNPRRLNPITGRIAPHRGVDFAVPVGTPVLAVGDGEVIVSKRDSIAGNYVAIRHGQQYMTRYMHLKKLLVKPGQKVKRGDRIGLSGNTGRSTGPHLHYEVWINQQAVNPLTAQLPYAEGLRGNDRAEYIAQVKQMLPQLQFN